jgi:exopolyphosphatase / guanosine-5'-triphosphate,3'-diphosphate pyrophosphatase
VRIAILDLGTNTFHLLIADVEEKKSKIIFRSKIAVKLGEGSIHNNWIAPRPFRRGINTLVLSGINSKA